jgi:hypothetical protein
MVAAVVHIVLHKLEHLLLLVLDLPDTLLLVASLGHLGLVLGDERQYARLLEEVIMALGPELRVRREAEVEQQLDHLGIPVEVQSLVSIRFRKYGRHVLSADLCVDLVLVV